MGADLLDALVGGDQLGPGGHVDAVEAGEGDRRGADAQVHLARAGRVEHLDELAGRVAAHDRVVDDDEALAGDASRRGLSFMRMPSWRRCWSGWMKVR